MYSPTAACSLFLPWLQLTGGTSIVAPQVLHGEHHSLDEAGGGGHGHANHDGVHGLCALSGYNAKEKRENFVIDSLITLNCFCKCRLLVPRATFECTDLTDGTDLSDG